MNTQERNKRRLIISGFVIALLIIILVISAVLSSSRSSKNGLISSDYQLYANSWYSINFPKDFKQGAADDSLTNTRFVAETGENTESFTVIRYGERSKLPKPADFTGLISGASQTLSNQTVNDYQAIRAISSSGETETQDYYIFGEYYVWKISFATTSNSDLKKDIEDLVNTFKPKDSDIKKLVSITLTRGRL